MSQQTTKLVPCKFGKTCRNLLQGSKCPFYHDPTEMLEVTGVTVQEPKIILPTTQQTQQTFETKETKKEPIEQVTGVKVTHHLTKEQMFAGLLKKIEDKYAQIELSDLTEEDLPALKLWNILLRRKEIH